MLVIRCERYCSDAKVGKSFALVAAALHGWHKCCAEYFLTMDNDGSLGGLFLSVSNSQNLLITTSTFLIKENMKGNIEEN
jgi:hypothetical protein